MGRASPLIVAAAAAAGAAALAARGRPRARSSRIPSAPQRAWSAPVDGALMVSPHGEFGARRPADARLPFDHAHQGVDLVAPPGSPIRAVADGAIVASHPGVGLKVRVLAIAGDLFVVYADMGTATVEPGQRVRRGQSIGTVFSHGFVHVAVRRGRFGPFIDPGPLVGLPPRRSAV